MYQNFKTHVQSDCFCSLNLLFCGVVITAVVAQTRTRTIKGIAPPTFVAQSPLQRCIDDGGHAEKVESKRSGIRAVYQEIKPNVSRKK